MHWLFLLFSIASMAFAMLTTSTGLLAACLLAAFVFFLVWVYAMYRARFPETPRDITTAIDLSELRRLREQAQARKQAQAEDDPQP